MKVILIIGAIIVIALSVLADYMWRRWMAARRSDHDGREDRRA